MHKNSFILCGLTLILGVFGAFFRWLQLNTAYEPDTGLVIPHSLWSIVMVVYLIVAAIVFFVIARWLKDNKKIATPLNYPEAFKGGKMICTVTAYVSLALIVLGGLLTIFEGIVGATGTYGIVYGAFAILAGISVFVVLRSINAKTQKGSALAFIIIVLYLCFMLIDAYRASAADPVVWNFAIRILAVCSVIMAYYYYAGYCFDKAKPFRAVFFSFLGVFLSIVNFADEAAISTHFIMAGIVLSQLVFTLLLVGNLVNASHDRLSPGRD